MIRPVATLALTLLVSQFTTLVLAQTVGSTGGDLTYNCPTRETIDTAYSNYCPGQSRSGLATLDATTSFTGYDNAPNNYQTNAGGFELQCNYNNQGDTFGCLYVAGGGQSLTPGEDNSDECPDVSAAVPQPSPGVNYRRRAQTQRRAFVGPAPAFVCPFNSNNPDVYVNGVEVDTGTYAVNNGDAAGYAVNSDQVFYGCGISTDVTCYYVQSNDGDLLFAGSNVAAAEGDCPQTLCTAINGAGANVRRGIYLEESAVRYQKRQVNTNKLRMKYRRALNARRP
nr:uncharacterized protein CI109_000438 [Kwoniella shandongensis]KAA5530868.1 hypothetical protein CI109_000438 [Kwoniella shandongensis]